MTKVPEVNNCVVVGPTSVQLRFDDGFKATLDLAPALRGPIFGELQQPRKFREVVVQDGTLVWPNGADICPSVLRYWCELGRVCPQEELDSHFTEPASRRVAETRAKYSRKSR
jgi:hypothetical protein